jgi:hypothetical protein
MENMQYVISSTVGWVAQSVRRMSYALDGPGMEFPVGARFSAPVQTSPAAQKTTCTMGTGSFPGVERGRGVTLTPHLLLVPGSNNRVGLYLYSP